MQFNGSGTAPGDPVVDFLKINLKMKMLIKVFPIYDAGKEKASLGKTTTLSKNVRSNGNESISF